jgi:uncharacterized protein (DUF1697 family)
VPNSTAYVALLRGVNVGGNANLAMAELREAVAPLGLDNVRTLLQSGNLLFAGPARSSAKLERQLQAAVLERLGLRTEFFVRTGAEWAEVVANNPFPREAQSDPGRLIVFFSSAAPALPAVEALRAAVTGPEVIRAGSRHLYITYPNGMGRSKLTGAAIEKKLGTTGTARNWNTVRKLHEASTS